MTTISVRVSEIIDEAAGIRTLRLVHPDGAPLGPYEAGAHIDVVGPTGLTRQYSLCGPPDDATSLLIAVKREAESRGGSLALHTVGVGDKLDIGTPRNLLAVDAAVDRHVLVAGGIGITPLLSLAYELQRRGADFEMHYFVRTRDEAAFLDLLQDRARFGDHVTVHVGVPRGEQGGVLAPVVAAAAGRTAVYTCGPAGFMDQVCAAFAPVVGPEHVHVEHFVAAEVDTSGDTAFTVELDTGEEYEIPANRSILSILEENGHDVFKSCEEGICGSCVSGVLEGEPDHRDSCLSVADRAAGDQMALCVSRARCARLKIELY
jgi:ferredoxin-NADP reductase